MFPLLPIRFPVVATGGTFDEIHAGHIALLSTAFEVGKKVIIGVSSDDFAIRRGKSLNHDFDERVENLKKMIKKEFGQVNYVISELVSDFGPAVTSGEVEALVASTETQDKGNLLNKIRSKKGLKPIQIVAVELIKAEDGHPISSTRIRVGEIDAKGKLLKKR